MKANLLTEIVTQVQSTVNQSKTVRQQIGGLYDNGLMGENEYLDALYSAVLMVSGKPTLDQMRSSLVGVYGLDVVKGLSRSEVDILFDKEFKNA